MAGKPSSETAVYDTICLFKGDMPGTNPLLGALQNNGGQTMTMALPVGSPAIDTANDVVCPATDQRGVTRPQGLGCDVGAYEYDG